MANKDTACSIHPYFKVQEGKMDEFKQLCEKFIDRVSSEPSCLYYGFSFKGNELFCREGYQDADGILAHVQNVGDLLQESLNISEITRLEIHGPEEELNKLRGPLADFNPDYWVLEYGIRN